MNENITQIAQCMQQVFITEADNLGRESGFIKRQVKVTGSSFIQTLVFGFSANPKSTYAELSQSSAASGVVISSQGLEQRFTPTAANFVKQMLEKMIGKVIVRQNQPNMPLLSRFNGVYLIDSSVITLPDCLTNIWEGNGNNKQEKTAALKMQVSLNYSSGEVAGPVLMNGMSQDQLSPYQNNPLPKGALRIGDLGYFSIKRFAIDDQEGVYWISRLKTGVVILGEDGQRIDLLHWLQQQTVDEMDCPVFMGAHQRIPCRLLVQHVPQAVAEQRRRRMREDGRVRRQPVTAERLALAEWTIAVTNVPYEMLSLKEALVFLRIRWQIELLFKLWKNTCLVDEWRSQNPWRILCEIYAKLIAVVLNQWLFSISLWNDPRRSLVRAVKIIQKFAFHLIFSLYDPNLLLIVLGKLVACLKSNCRLEKRKKCPASFQLLQDSLC